MGTVVIGMVFVCLSVRHTGEPCENKRMDWSTCCLGCVLGWAWGTACKVHIHIWLREATLLGPGVWYVFVVHLIKVTETKLCDCSALQMNRTPSRWSRSTWSCLGLPVVLAYLCPMPLNLQALWSLPHSRLTDSPKSTPFYLLLFRECCICCRFQRQCGLWSVAGNNHRKVIVWNPICAR